MNGENEEERRREEKWKREMVKYRRRLGLH